MSDVFEFLVGRGILKPCEKDDDDIEFTEKWAACNAGKLPCCPLASPCAICMIQKAAREFARADEEVPVIVTVVVGLLVRVADMRSEPMVAMKMRELFDDHGIGKPYEGMSYDDIAGTVK